MTGKPAPYSSKKATLPSFQSNRYPWTNDVKAVPLPISTPPLSPSVSSDASSSFSSTRSLNLHGEPTFLLTLFPNVDREVADCANTFKFNAEGTIFDGFVLDLSTNTRPLSSNLSLRRALFVDGKNVEPSHLRECVVALLDVADGEHQCEAFFIALDKTGSAFGSLLHSLMYVGGSVVSMPPFELNKRYVLVGLEL